MYLPMATPPIDHARAREIASTLDLRALPADFYANPYLFGTAVKSTKKFPEHYGVVGDYMPDGFVRQQLFPFRGSTKPRDPTA